jgi:NADPH2:quinone reductase
VVEAIVCEAFGPVEDLSIQQLPESVPAVGEVLIHVNAVGVNFPDALLVRGLYQVKPTLPFTPGIECAGTIAALGEGVERFAVGDRVAAMSPRFGTYAETVVVPASHAYALPDALDFDHAGALLCAYGTAYHALVQRAVLRPGETLLVTGAAGGTGLAAVQIGHALGAHVIAVCSSKEKMRTAKQHGADVAIHTGETDVRETVKSLTGGAGVDVIFDPVGGDLAQVLARSTGWNGRWLVIGFAEGTIPKIPLNLPLVKGYSIVGVFWGSFCDRDPAQAQSNHRQLFEMAANGSITPYLHAVMPLKDASNALGQIERREVRGKIVLKP